MLKRDSDAIKISTNIGRYLLTNPLIKNNNPKWVNDELFNGNRPNSTILYDDKSSKNAANDILIKSFLYFNAGLFIDINPRSMINGNPASMYLPKGLPTSHDPENW